MTLLHSTGHEPQRSRIVQDTADAARETNTRLVREMSQLISTTQTEMQTSACVCQIHMTGKLSSMLLPLASKFASLLLTLQASFIKV